MSNGHVRRRGKTSWGIKFELGSDPATGRRRIRYVNFRGTRRGAEIELARLVIQHAAGEDIDPLKVTITAFFESWTRDWVATNVSPKTHERYQQIIRLNVVPHLGSMPIQKLRPVHLQELYSRLLREGGHEGRPLAPASVSYVHRVLHRALGHATTWGITTKNVASSVSPPPKAEDEIVIMTEEQIDAMLRHLEGRSLRPIVSFLLGTGCRRGEALALRWQDVDLDRAVVRIERSVEQIKGALRIKSPKTKHGRRNVSISPWLVAELRAHRRQQQEQRLSLGMGRTPDDALVFGRWDGSMRSPHGVTQKFALAMKALGIACTLHSLRHSHVSRLIAGGVDILTISRRIGHAGAVVTLGTYGHMCRNTDEGAANVMETAFAKVHRRQDR
jgi:integrase